MRIIAGRLKGRRLKAPPGLAVRPTSDRVRENLFNILGVQVEGSSFLDLYAGTGAIGLEALSRGARRIVWVDNNPVSLRILDQNRRSCGVAETGEVITGNLPDALYQVAGSFDLVFVDPPYAFDGVEALLGHAAWERIVHSESLLVLERDIRHSPPTRAGLWVQYRTVHYGETALHFYRRGLPADEQV